MPKPVSLAIVRKIALALPDIEECVTWGKPTFKVHGKMMACVPSHRSAEPGSLVVRVNFDDRAALLAEAPEVYYITDHYAGYTGVLVRLSRVTPDMLRDLLSMAHKFVTRQSARRPSARKRRNAVTRK
ncbi:MAG TPA: MmcQ/YjbR family DNA-binding protein [Terriglobales bacterium]|jgi:hypothetical protein